METGLLMVVRKPGEVLHNISQELVYRLSPELG